MKKLLLLSILMLLCGSTVFAVVKTTEMLLNIVYNNNVKRTNIKSKEIKNGNTTRRKLN